MPEIKLAKFARVPPGAAMDKTLSKAALKVLIALCGHADSKDICRPTQTRLALVSSLSRQHVNRAIQELCERGWITLVGKRAGRGRRPSNVYKINFDTHVCHSSDSSPCHQRGDAEIVTAQVTRPRHLNGDTNKPSRQKRKEQRYSLPNLSPYAALTTALARKGFSSSEIDLIILTLDPVKYEEFCDRYEKQVDKEQLVEGFAQECCMATSNNIRLATN